MDHGEGLAEPIGNGRVVLPRRRRQHDRRERRAELVAQHGEKAILGLVGGPAELLLVERALPFLGGAQPFDLHPPPLAEIDHRRMVGAPDVASRAEGAARELDQHLGPAARPQRDLRHDQLVAMPAAAHVVEKRAAVGFRHEHQQRRARQADAVDLEEARAGEVAALDDAVGVQHETRQRPEVEELLVFLVGELELAPGLDQRRMLRGQLLPVDAQILDQTPVRGVVPRGLDGSVGRSRGCARHGSLAGAHSGFGPHDPESESTSISMTVPAWSPPPSRRRTLASIVR